MELADFDPAAFAEEGRRLRSQWSSPFSPLRPGEMRCCYRQRGVIEWLCHLDLALRLLEEGIIIAGRRTAVQLVDRWPAIDALQILAEYPDESAGTFVDASRAGVAA